MSRRTKIYIAFDGDSDLMSYRTLQSWHGNDAISFNLNDAHDVNTAKDDSLPESIIKQLKERLDVSKILILLIGEKTKNNRKGILKYELQYALKNKIPIVLVFIGFSGDDEKNTDLWSNTLKPKVPSVVINSDIKYTLISPFTKKAIEYAIKKYSNNNLPSEGYTWNWK